MNQALGRAGVVLGLAAAVFGAVTVAVGLGDRSSGRPRQRQVVRLPDPRRRGRSPSWPWSAALITRDFSIEYVAENGSSKTPALYNVATLWAALEGSILLWGLVLSGYLVATTAKFRRRLEDPLVGWALLTIFVVAAFFFMLLVGPANPFRDSALPPGFVDGPGPNPLLQNHPLMAIHPPMLYLGYVGFTVPFAFAIAALGDGPPRRGLARRHPPLDARARGGSSPSASCSARGGATRSSGGAATGRGTRSRTPASCRG